MMKIILDKNKVVNVFSRIQGIIERNELIPILSNVLIEAKNNYIDLYATNLKISLLDKCEAEIEREGKVLVDAKNIFEIIKESSDKKIFIEEKEKNVYINYSKTFFNLPKYNLLDFPKKTEIESNFQINKFSKVNAKKLNEMLKKTIYAISDDESKSELRGSLLEVELKDNFKVLKVISTDGHRLSFIEKKEEDNELYNEELNYTIIPKRGLQEINKLLEDENQNEIIKLWKDEKRIFINKNNTILSILLIEGEFPDYKRVLAYKGEVQIKIATLDLLEALKRVSILLDNKKCLRVILKNKKFSLNVSNELGEANEDIEIDFYGEREFYINYRYLKEAISSIEDEFLLIELKGPKDPIKITPQNNKRHIIIIMPIIM